MFGTLVRRTANIKWTAGRLARLAIQLLLIGAAPPPDNIAQQFVALRTMDARLAAIGYRLARANVALCDRRQLSTGIVFQAIDHYNPAMRPVATQVFGFPAPVAVELVVPGSPDADAGIAAGESVVAIDSAPTPLERFPFSPGHSRRS